MDGTIYMLKHKMTILLNGWNLLQLSLLEHIPILSLNMKIVKERTQQKQTKKQKLYIAITNYVPYFVVINQLTFSNHHG
jgi:P pilus assembly chaperone PapD